MSVSSALAYAAQHELRFVDELKSLLRIPSVSTDPAYAGEVRRAAVWIADHLHEIGIGEVQIHATEGHPIVTAAHMHDAQRPTVLVYGHYDVQPPDPLDLWETPPFEPTERGGQIVCPGSQRRQGTTLYSRQGRGIVAAHRRRTARQPEISDRRRRGKRLSAPASFS